MSQRSTSHQAESSPVDGNIHKSKVTKLKHATRGLAGYLCRLYKKLDAHIKHNEQNALSLACYEKLNESYVKYCNSFEQYKAQLTDESEIQEALSSFKDQFNKKLLFDERFEIWLQSHRSDRVELRADAEPEPAESNLPLGSIFTSPLTFNADRNVNNNENANLLKENFELQLELQRREMTMRQQQLKFEIERRELEYQRRELELKLKLKYLNTHSSTETNTTESSTRGVNVNARKFVPPSNTDSENDNWKQMQLDFFKETIKMFRDSLDMPKQELLRFDGNSLNYWRFIRNFNANIHERNISDKAKLNHLISLCDNDVRISIEDCAGLESSEGYSEALDILRKEYGLPHIVANAHRNNIVEGPAVGNWDSSGLADLSRKMRSCSMTMKQMGYWADVNSSDTITKILSRLPFSLRCKWANHADCISQKGELPSFSDLAIFVEESSRVANSLHGKQLESTKPSPRNHSVKSQDKSSYKPSRITTMAATTATQINDCAFCKESTHAIVDCNKFKNLTFDESFSFVRNARLCNNCLLSGHIARNCWKPSQCSFGCKGKHHKIMHRQNTTNDKTLSNVATVCSSKYSLRVVPVLVKANGRSLETSALIDSGSDITMCSNAVVDALKCHGKPKTMSLNSVTDSKQINTIEVALIVEPFDGSEQVYIPNVGAIDQLPIAPNTFRTPEDLARWSHLKGIEIPPSNSNIGILIGTNVPEVFWVLDERRGKRKQPYTIKSILGWSVIGPLVDITDSESKYVNCVQSKDDLVKSQIESLWNTDFDDLNFSAKGLSKNDLVAIDKLNQGLRIVDRHYELPLPWVNECPELSDNYRLAMSRLNYLKSRFQKDADFWNKYTAVVNGYINDGYAEVVPFEELADKPAWYLPHHGVVNPMKPEKLRVVFDCAAKFNEKSLNSELLQGPDLVNNLVAVLTRFRKHPIALVSDIKSMFHQVKVKPADTNTLRFVWWPNGDILQKPVVYRMLVHIFGAKSSPCCASYCLHKTADDNESKFSAKSIEILRKNFYVDDCLFSVTTESQALDLVDEMKKLLACGGFELTKWLSNSQLVLETLPECDRAKCVVKLDLDKLPCERTLGVQWDLNLDDFRFHFCKREKPPTRRGILSVVSSLYDPLGMVSPYILLANLILQTVCRKLMGWDEVNINLIKLKRCLLPPSISNPMYIQLHNFSDASQAAYGAVSYLRVSDELGHVEVKFIMGKSRLAPIKSVTIPRLELSAAVLSVTLNEFVTKEIDIDIDNSFYWVDSSTVLAYINNHNKRFHVFVANRLRKIENGSNPSQWHHIPSELNPADIGSRGMCLKALANSCWLKGPNFLFLPKSEYGLNKL